VSDELTRRELLKLGAAATLTVSLGQAETLAQPAAFFTSDELALVDELSDIIIPADAHSPGARAAKVAAYIDARLAEEWDAAERTAWRDGLNVVGQLSQRLNGKEFLKSSPDERVAVVARMAANEANPRTPEEVFFIQLKARVVGAYYTSQIGIREEMEYQGNSYLPEFVGFDVSQR
jgi:hypothetical protein